LYDKLVEEKYNPRFCVHVAVHEETYSCRESYCEFLDEDVSCKKVVDSEIPLDYVFGINSER